MDTVKLSVLFYNEGDVWVAQAIEADIAATAVSLAKLPKAFERAVIANLAANSMLGRKGLEGLPPAPEAFRVRFEDSELSLHRRQDRKGARQGDMLNIRVAA